MLSTIIVFLFNVAALLANPLQTTPSRLLTNTSFNGLFTLQPTLNVTTTNITAPNFIGCFYQSDPPTLLPTTKTDCEAALDAWVSGQDLYVPRVFSRMRSHQVQDVTLPFIWQYRTCVIQLDMQGENNEDTMSLADVYAGIMGPDGLVKRCLGLENPDALGGMMSVGPNRKLLVLINGMEIGGEAS